MKPNSAPPSFTKWIDLASERIGGRALLASDEFFAPKQNLLKSGRGIFIPEKFTENGKWMDGWETRRKRLPGHDWCIIRLGSAGRIAGVDIDTNHFLGNHPPFASIEACALQEEPVREGQWQQVPWLEILPKSSLEPGSRNIFEIKNSNRFTHLRLNIFPDGGIARFRAFGEVLRDWSKFRSGTLTDLAAVENGGRVTICNDMFFGPKDNLIMPGRADNMGDGWETKRKRQPGYDWVVVKLGVKGRIQMIEVDTNHFKGNYPDQCSLEACLVLGSAETELPDSNTSWVEILPKVKLEAHNRHFFEKELKNVGQDFTHVRLNIYPDGGVSRLRLFGFPNLS